MAPRPAQDCVVDLLCLLPGRMAEVHRCVNRRPQEVTEPPNLGIVSPRSLSGNPEPELYPEVAPNRTVNLDPCGGLVAKRGDAPNQTQARSLPLANGPLLSLPT